MQLSRSGVACNCSLIAQNWAELSGIKLQGNCRVRNCLQVKSTCVGDPIFKRIHNFLNQIFYIWPSMFCVMAPVLSLIIPIMGFHNILPGRLGFWYLTQIKQAKMMNNSATYQRFWRFGLGGRIVLARPEILSVPPSQIRLKTSSGGTIESFATSNTSIIIKIFLENVIFIIITSYCVKISRCLKFSNCKHLRNVSRTLCK